MTGSDVAIEIGKLADLDIYALRDRWRARYGSEPPVRMSRELPLRAVAYRIQEKAFGGLSAATKRKLLAIASRSGSESPRRVRKQHDAKPGTRFLREWKGRTHEVVALENGRFAYRGTVYRSLSVIAREITGTRWSGPTFFGLNTKERTRGDAD
jgi:hypothetical protein